MEKISVYIPRYNAERFIVKAVRSILAQTLDDGCTDRSIEANQQHVADRWRAQHMPFHWGDKKSVINPKVIYCNGHESPHHCFLEMAGETIKISPHMIKKEFAG